MKNDIKIIKEWRVRIREITDDITSIVEKKYIYDEIVGVISKNQSINKQNLFYDFLKLNYIESIISGICRQIDCDKDSQSLINLLHEIFEKPEIITKQWFITQYGKNEKDEFMDNMKRGIGENDFNKDFGKGNFVDPLVVYSDIGRLIYHTREIKKFRNKRVAHKDKNKKLRFKVSFAYINKSIKTLEEITIKYGLLLNQSMDANNTLLPIIQYDWQEIFKLAWIK